MKNRMNEKKEGFVLWFTGLSGSGKTTNALAVYKQLKKEGFAVEYLDGDVVRENLSHDLGFSKNDRDENIKRVSFVTGLLSRNGVGVICSFISPYKKQRDFVRGRTENFIEVFCNCSLEGCEQRDIKGLYKKARAGEIDNFTGISDVYEKPENPNIVLDTFNKTPEETFALVIEYLKKDLFFRRRD